MAVGGSTKVPRNTLRAHVVERLRGAILAGDLAPGRQVVETALAERFGVSRGPLREAIRQLIDEGLLVTVPYTGTYVTGMSVRDVREIYSFRIALETFAFEQAWERRGTAFRTEMGRRLGVLTGTIADRDDAGSISAELDLHGLVYEASGHGLLLNSWVGLRGRLQLYWANHHRAHGMRGPRRDGHDSYVATALGGDLDAMRAEVRDHMLRGAEQTEGFLAEVTAAGRSSAA